MSECIHGFVNPVAVAPSSVNFIFVKSISAAAFRAEIRVWNPQPFSKFKQTQRRIMADRVCHAEIFSVVFTTEISKTFLQTTRNRFKTNVSCRSESGFNADI